MAYQNTFKRFELKYLLTRQQQANLIPMDLPFPKSGENLYNILFQIRHCV